MKQQPKKKAVGKRKAAIQKPKATPPRTSSPKTSRIEAHGVAENVQPPIQPTKPTPKAPDEPKPRALPASFKMAVPSILLEGDKPVLPPKSGPGEKFATGSAACEPRAAAHRPVLPHTYGTGTLNALARDPFSLFVSWDFTDDQQRYYNSLSADKHLVLRGHFDSLAGPVAVENHLHPETRHWFLHVPEAARTYFAAIGYYLQDGSWITLRGFGPVTTPPDRAALVGSVQFAYAASVAPQPETRHSAPTQRQPQFKPEQRFAHPIAPTQTFPERESAGGMHETIRTAVLPQLEQPTAPPAPSWTADQERALTVIISSLIKREGLPGSLELLEILRREVAKQPGFSLAELGMLLPSSAEVSPPALRAEGVPSSLPPGADAPARKGFWFNINAELIVYGATEPDARVTIGGRSIKLRPDGSFSYRFALPDGAYELPAQAASTDGADLRRAELRFSRQTDYSGEVGAHPQDEALRIPAAENVA